MPAEIPITIPDLKAPEFLAEFAGIVAPVLRRRDNETREQFVERVRRVEDASNVQ